MKTGIDVASNVGAQADCLAQAGINFVMRYYSPHTTHVGKQLTNAEAAQLSSAGIDVGVVFEGNPTYAGYFTSAQGEKDGSEAWAVAQGVGQPQGSCIYFAVDYDAAPADLDAIVSYFTAVQDGLSSAAGGAAPYVLGVYGSGRVCQLIKEDKGLAQYSWLSGSTGWGGSHLYVTWDIQQSWPSHPVCSLGPKAYDSDQAQDDFGGFRVQTP